MQNTPFNKPGRFWKGNLHTHSTRSDGVLPPEQVCQLYREAGYDFLCITDHFSERYHYPITDTRGLNTPEFVTLLGAEMHAPQTEWGELWHLLGIGLPEDFAPNPATETAPELVNRALQAGAFVAVAHPGWYALTEQDIRSLGPIHAIETFNGTAIDDNDRADGWHIYEVMLARGGRYFALSSDDAHFSPDRLDTLLGWVMVKSETLTPDALLTALKNGDYYCSTGPQIFDLHVEAGSSLKIRCTPVSHVFITGRGAAFDSVRGVGLMQAEFDLRDFKGPYVRVTVRDAAGRRAWTQPIWF